MFEESHWQADEVVMLKLLELSTMVYRCDAAAHMSARAAWNVFQTCIMIRNQSRVSIGYCPVLHSCTQLRTPHTSHLPHQSSHITR